MTCPCCHPFIVGVQALGECFTACAYSVHPYYKGITAAAGVQGRFAGYGLYTGSIKGNEVFKGHVSPSRSLSFKLSACQAFALATFDHPFLTLTGFVWYNLGESTLEAASREAGVVRECCSLDLVILYQI